MSGQQLLEEARKAVTNKQYDEAEIKYKQIINPSESSTLLLLPPPPPPPQRQNNYNTKKVLF